MICGEFCCMQNFCNNIQERTIFSKDFSKNTLIKFQTQSAESSTAHYTSQSDVYQPEHFSVISPTKSSSPFYVNAIKVNKHSFPQFQFSSIEKNAESRIAFESKKSTLHKKLKQNIFFSTIIKDEATSSKNNTSSVRTQRIFKIHQPSSNYLKSEYLDFSSQAHSSEIISESSHSLKNDVNIDCDIKENDCESDASSASSISVHSTLNTCFERPVSYYTLLPPDRELSYDVQVEREGVKHSRIAEAKKNALLSFWQEEDAILSASKPTFAIPLNHQSGNLNADDSGNNEKSENKEIIKSSCNEVIQEDIEKMDRWKKKRRTLTKMQIKAAKDHQRLFGEWVKKSWMIDEEEEKMWEEAEKKIVVKENVEAQEEGIEIQQSNHTIEELKGMLLEISEHGLDGKEKEELEKEIARIERRQEKGEKNEAVSVLDRYLEEDQKRSAKGKKRYGWFPDVNVNKQKNGDKRFSSQASMLDHYAECEGDMSCDAVDELEERSKNEPLNQLNISQYPHSNEEIVPSQEKNTSPFLFLHNLENVSQNEHASIFPVFCQQTSTPAMASSVEKESSLDIPFPFSVNIQSSPHSSSKLHSSVQKFRQSLLIPPSSHSLSDHEAPCFDSRNKPNEESISFISHSLLSTIRENHEDDASLVKVINVENLLEHDSNIERGLKIDEAEVLRRFDNRFFSSRKNNHRLQNHIQLVEEVKRIQSIVIWLNPILTSRKQFRK